MDVVCEIEKQLMDWADVGYARFSSGLIPNLSRPMLGVRLPRLRTLARKLSLRADVMEVLHAMPVTYFEEVMLRGMMIGYIPMDWERRWREIMNFVPLMDNWSICDSCSATYKDIASHRSQVWPDLLKCLKSEREFVQRFAIVVMLDYFLEEDWTEEVLKVWRTFEPRGFYAEMAMGWGLSVAFLRWPEQTMSLLRDSSVSLVCRRLACKKIMESFRTPQEYRSIIKSLKSELVSR